MWYWFTFWFLVFLLNIVFVMLSVLILFSCDRDPWYLIAFLAVMYTLFYIFLVWTFSEKVDHW